MRCHQALLIGIFLASRCWPLYGITENPKESENILDIASDKLTQRNPVTGKVAVNTISLVKEIEIGRTFEKQYIELLRKKGLQIDTDQASLIRIGKIINSLIPVCHLPKFPWRYHYNTSPEFNACALPGGAIFVNKGCLKMVNDTELAAILGHELAHVTCRHMAETKGQMLGVGLFSTEARTSRFYQANFSTQHENQADQVGLMYMAAAGFDPTQTSLLWDKMNKRFGSSQNGYMSDHGLNYERAFLTKKYGKQDLKYFLGPGKINYHPDYLKTLDKGKNDNKMVNLLMAGVNLSREHDKTHQEAEDRQKKAVVLSRFQFSNPRVIKPLFGGELKFVATIKNLNTFRVRKVIMEVVYVGTDNMPTRTEPWSIDNMNPSEIRHIEVKVHPAANERIKGHLTQVEF